MNDAFIFAIIQLIEGDYVTRMSVEVAARIVEISALVIHVFTYLRVAGTVVNPKKLLRHP